MSLKIVTLLHLEWIKHQKDLLDLEHRLLQQELENEVGAKYDYDERVAYYQDLKVITAKDEELYLDYKNEEVLKSEIQTDGMFILNELYKK